MAWCHTVLACLALCAVATVQARLMHDEGATRSLQQFSAQPFCPAGCTDTGCVQDNTGAGLRCQKCLGNLLVNKVDGKCACPAGKYVRSKNFCTDCPKGSWCAGDDYSEDASGNPTGPGKVDCPTNMTTLGLRSTSLRACVNMQGTYYTISADGLTVAAIGCPVNTYSPGLKKQRACVPCPTGYTTNGVERATSPNQCVVPAGYFLKAPGQVAPCPKGEYKSGVGSNGNCTKCAFGVTTAQEASTKVEDCTIVVPGYFARTIANGIVTSTVVCPQGYYCKGGVPTAAFNPTSPVPDNTHIFACPNGTWTIDLGSTDAQQCLTPPGYYTDATGTSPCPVGTYRADWKPLGEAKQCQSCGAGVLTEKTDQVTAYHVSNNSAYQVAITTSADDCYIQPGQGLYYTTLDNTWRARNCNNNNYGVSNRTYGLTPYACRDCPVGMVTSSNATGYPNSASYFIRNADGTNGFWDVKACVTQAGYGYNGRVAQQCDQGWYNNKDTYLGCSQCGYGLTTQGVGKGAIEADCGLAPGYGWDTNHSTILPCPIGTYNDRPYTANRQQVCTACPLGTTTPSEGADNSNLCNLCIGGYGGLNCASVCGAPAATYGTPGRSLSTDCTSCTTMDTGYSFEWNMQNDLFVSPAVARQYANSSLDCLAKYGQLTDGAWYLPMQVGDTQTEVSTGVTTFQACVDKCNHYYCEFVTYDYVAQTCSMRNGTEPVLIGAPLIAFKNLPSGDVGTNAWSVSEQKKVVKGKRVTTGSYTFYREPQALLVGTQVLATGASGFTELQDCLNACDDDILCAGITIEMNVDIPSRPTTCRKISGVVKVGQFKRTVTRADTTRLALPSLKDL